MKPKVLLLLLLSGLASCAAYKKLTSDNKRVSASGGLKSYDGNNPDKILELITKNRIDALESISIKKYEIHHYVLRKNLEKLLLLNFMICSIGGNKLLSKSFGSFDVLLKKGGIYQKALVKNDREIPIIYITF